MTSENSDGTAGKSDVTLTIEKPETPNVETYTKEQVEKMVRDARSAVGADIGRLQKVANDAIERLRKVEQERQADEEEAAKDDPDELTRIRERRSTKAELDRVTQELNATKESAAEWEAEKATRAREKTAREIATRLNVNLDKVISLAAFTNGSPEAIEAVAKELPKSGKRLRPDGGQMVGGLTTFEEARAAYIKDPRDPAVKEQYLRMRRERKR